MSIPKKIFTIWLNDEIPMPETLVNWVKTHDIPGYEHKLITLENCYRGDRYIQEAIGAKKWVKASDFLRMYYLYTEGGIYLDCDMEVLKPEGFEPLLENKMFITSEAANGYFANAAIGAESGHPSVGRYLYLISTNFRGDGCLTFEPGIRAWCDIMFITNKEALGIKWYEPEYFFPYSNITLETKITDKTICIHHYVTMWESK